MVLRRRIDTDTSTLLGHQSDTAGQAPSLVEIIAPDRAIYEYTALVTSTDAEPLTLAGLYRSRADAENILDELKNHWGWGGFTTHDLARTQTMARMTALVYNWWSLFVRLIDSIDAARGDHQPAAAHGRRWPGRPGTPAGPR